MPPGTPEPGDPRPEPLLIGLARRGDRRSVIALLARYRRWVRAVAHRRFGAAPLADDVARRTLLAHVALLRAGIPGSLPASLHATISREAAALGAREKLGRDGPGDPDLRAALDALDHPRRELLMLRVVDGMSNDDASAALGIDPVTARAGLHDTLRALHAEPKLARYFGSPTPPGR